MVPNVVAGPIEGLLEGLSGPPPWAAYVPAMEQPTLEALKHMARLERRPYLQPATAWSTSSVDRLRCGGAHAVAVMIAVSLSVTSPAAHAQVAPADLAVDQASEQTVDTQQPNTSQKTACTQDDLDSAVDAAGQRLRAFNADAMPELQVRFEQLKTRKGWGSATRDERVADYLADARTAALDAKAGTLMATLDQLGRTNDASGGVDCAQLAELEAAGLELLAVMKTKKALMTARLDRELGSSTTAAMHATPLGADPGRGSPETDPLLGPLELNEAEQPPSLNFDSSQDARAPTTAAATTVTAQSKQSHPGKTAQQPSTTPATPREASTKTPALDNQHVERSKPDARAAPLPATSWQTETRIEPAPRDDLIARQRQAQLPAINQGLEQTPPDSRQEAPEGATDGGDIAAPDGYTMEEIRNATHGFFGTLSTNLASVIEYAFQNWGRPTGYILGKEGGGAFLAGLRYGQGTLYPRYGSPTEIYWQGPSLGYDVGAAGSRTLILVYGMARSDDLMRMFTGLDGSAYLVGGVGLTVLKGGPVIMTPIRSGLGLRLGANLGYLRFSQQPTWNPF